MALLRKHREDNLIEYFGKKGSSLQPNPLQARVIDAFLKPQYRLLGMTGANQIGKTTLGAIIAHVTMFGKLPWDDTDLSYLFPHNKPRKVRYVGQDWRAHIEAVVIPELRKWWPKSRLVKTVGNGTIKDTSWTDVKTGSSIQVMSNFQDSDVHEGARFDLVIFDEPPTRDIWIANSRGLIARKGRALFCMTLLKEAWIHTDIVKRMLPDGRPDRSVFFVDGEQAVNVGYGITQEGSDNFYSDCNETERQARFFGKPAYLAGLVCKFFDRHTHVVDRFPIPTDWPVDIAIDIHPRKEQAVLFVATDQRDERYACFEIWEHGDGPQTADRIIRIVQRYALRVNRIIIDPLAKGDANNEHTTYDKIEMVLARHGYVLETATKDKSSGIIEINNHLKGPNNKPSLFFFHDMVKTIKQLEGWMYDKDTQVPAKVEDDMPENLYRLMLLGTEYVPPEEDYDEADDYGDTQPDSVTGY